MAGRKRKAGKREPNGRLSRAEVKEDPRDVVIQARRRRLMASRLDMGCDSEKWRIDATAPVTKEERAIFRLCGDRLFDLEMRGELHPDQVSAGHDFAARYLRYAVTNGIPRRTAKISTYGAIKGLIADADDETAERAKMAHFEDCRVIRLESYPGALDHVFRACVEDARASIYLLRSGLDALIRLHK